MAINLQEFLKQYANEDGTVDYEKANLSLNTEIDTQIGATKAKATKSLKEELENLKIENGTLAKQMENYTGKDEYYQERIATMGSELETFKRKSQIHDFTEEAKKYSVAPEIVENFINSGSDLTKVDLKVFQGAPNPYPDLGAGAGSDDINPEDEKAIAEAIAEKAMETARNK